jgi:hypothetical protein
VVCNVLNYVSEAFSVELSLTHRKSYPSQIAEFYNSKNWICTWWFVTSWITSQRRSLLNWVWHRKSYPSQIAEFYNSKNWICTWWFVTPWITSQRRSLLNWVWHIENHIPVKWQNFIIQKTGFVFHHSLWYYYLKISYYQQALYTVQYSN